MRLADLREGLSASMAASACSLGPAISVVLPIYNAADYVAEGIRSLVDQSLSDIEIICVDDGSSDGTADLLDALAETDARIKVIHKENGGAGSARNAGLAAASGEYLSFLDIDDFFEPAMLQGAYETAKLDDLDIVVFRSDEYYVESGEYQPIPWTIHADLLPEERVFAGTDVRKDVFKLFVGWAWDKLFRTSFVRENGLQFQEIRTTNDMLFVFSAVVKADRIGTMDDVLIHHRKDVGSLSVTREKSWRCFYEALTALREQLRAWDLYERFERDYLNYCVHAALWNVRTLAKPTRTLLTQRLADEWFDALGVPAHDEAYYYNKGEYEEFLRIYDPGRYRRRSWKAAPRKALRRAKRLLKSSAAKGGR